MHITRSAVEKPAMNAMILYECTKTGWNICMYPSQKISKFLQQIWYNKSIHMRFPEQAPSAPECRERNKKRIKVG